MDATQRFTDRAIAYERARPGYPKEAVDAIRTELEIEPGQPVVDLGSGTGLFTEQWLEAGCEVWAVEPNVDMAVVAETRWQNEPRFHSVRAPAEATGMAAGSVRAAVCAQAFHWLDSKRLAIELNRIIVPGGGVALVWNRRRLSGTPFLEAYEAYLHTWGRDYAKVASTYESVTAMQPIFQGSVPQPVTFENRQPLDREGLYARIASCSYMPDPTSPENQAMDIALDRLFETHEANRQVMLVYDTVVYAGLIRR